MANTIEDNKRLFYMTYVPGALATMSLVDLESKFFSDPVTNFAGAWTPFLSFGANVSATADAGAYSPQARKEPGDAVRLRGKIDFAAIITAGTALFTLDTAFRPTKQVALNIRMSNGTSARMFINTDGTCNIGVDTVAATSLFLDGITFTR